MIKKVSCENFYSIGKKIILDLTTTQSKASNNSNYFFEDGRHSNAAISLLSVVIGMNSAGKTSVLRAVPFARHLICETYKNPVERDILSFEPHVLMAEFDSSISVEFLIEDNTYEYSITFNKRRILKEQIKELILHKDSSRANWKIVCARHWIDKNKKYQLVNNFNGKIDEDDLRGDVSMINTIARYPSNEPVYSIYRYWFESINHNVTFKGHIETNLDDITRSILVIRDDLYKKERVNKILKDLEIGFDDFLEEDKNTIDKGKVKSFSVAHKYGNIVFSTDLKDESSGTRSLFSIIPNCVFAIETGGTLILDEMDAFLNPFVVTRILQLFEDPTINTRHAQLIFSSHNSSVIKKLKKNMIHICRKKGGFTELVRFDKVPGIRNDIDYVTKYLDGGPMYKDKIDLLWKKVQQE